MAVTFAGRGLITARLAGARVQGQGAAEDISRAIELLDGSGLCDVIIAGRGGGSIEDLWAFNEERVVRAFANCSTPIVSAVGHETDTLLSDHAADRRAPTPTAAAEMVVPQVADLRAHLGQGRQRMMRGLRRQIAAESRHLGQLRERLDRGEAVTGHRRSLLSAAARASDGRHRRLAELRRRLHRAHPMHRLALRQRALAKLRARLMRRGEWLTRQHSERLIRLDGMLRALNPTAALARGYSILRDPATGAAVVDAHAVADGQALEVLLARGTLDVEVKDRHVDPTTA